MPSGRRGGASVSGLFASLALLAKRILEYYVGPGRKNTIEYWQRYTFYIIALSGIAAGTICLVPVTILIITKGQYIGAAALVGIYAINVIAIFSPGLPVKRKTLVIASNFYIFGVISLILAGPEGESGIWFSVSVLICSLFIGWRASTVIAVTNLLTGLFFGVLHARGLIGWDVLVNFTFTSWLIQSANIFIMDMMFVLANTILIRGVDSQFTSLDEANGHIRAALAEKETLIRELYHRSKNNMQVVSSLLRLHSPQLREAQSRDVFKDVLDKISSMALVHQKLYESQDLSNIDMAEYMRELVPLLMESYGVTPGRIAVRYDLEDIPLLIDTAIPCGLVVSEVIANSLKYAFPDGRTGRIDICMKKEDDERVLLRIADDGVGLPEGFDVNVNGKLGMKTVFTMVQHQMQGDIRLQSGAGVGYDIRFRQRLYKERVRVHG